MEAGKEKGLGQPQGCVGILSNRNNWLITWDEATVICEASCSTQGWFPHHNRKSTWPRTRAKCTLIGKAKRPLHLAKSHPGATVFLILYTTRVLTAKLRCDSPTRCLEPNPEVAGQCLEPELDVVEQCLEPELGVNGQCLLWSKYTRTCSSNSLPCQALTQWLEFSA